MTGTILLSTAYLPPVEYFSQIADAGRVLIESHENYIKQTYRNRCYILSSSGPQLLSVPVYEGSRHKIPITEVRIDYSKRWQQVHLRAIRAAYGNSPYFDFYFDEFEKILMGKREFLFDLNCELLISIIRMLKINADIHYTNSFEPITKKSGDLRYTLVPDSHDHYCNKTYMQVFGSGNFTPYLSIIDLIFNMGPEAAEYL